eukprot:1158104-Pelagomonas_calceolata.AAC.7
MNQADVLGLAKHVLLSPAAWIGTHPYPILDRQAPAVKHHYSGLELYSGKQKYPTLMHFLMSAHVSGKFYSTCTLEKAINQYTSTAIPYHSQKPNASQVTRGSIAKNKHHGRERQQQQLVITSSDHGLTICAAVLEAFFFL